MSTVTSEIRLRVRAEGDKVLADLGAKLNSLANQATLSSNNFKGLAEELKKVQQTTVQSTNNIKAYSASWRELASSVDISSKEFKQATAEAARLDAQLAKVQGTSVRTAAAVQTAIRGPVTGGTAGAGIMGRPAAALEPYPRLGFETLDPEFHRKRQQNAQDKQGNVLGQFNQPQFLDYKATGDALANYQDSLQAIRDVQNKSNITRLELQEKYNNAEIKKADEQAAKVLAKDRQNAEIGGRDFMQRLENREKQQSQRRQRFAGAAQTAGAIAASGVFGGPEGLVGASIGALGGPGGAAAGGAIGAQVGMLRQAIGDTATYASEITKLNIALKGITKTSQEYSDAQNAINSISKSLNVPISDATSAFTRLSASVIGAGGNVNDAEIVFKGITTAMKATGRSTADVQGAILAMSQVFSKGKLSSEELSGQLGERLPGAVTSFAKATNRTLPQLQKDLENGVVGLNDVLKFGIALQIQYGETAAKVANSSEEAGARMTVAFDELKLAIGSAFQPIGADFQDSITEMAKAAVSAFKIFKEKIDQLNKSIANLIGNDNLKGLQFFFKTIVLEALAAVDPLTKIYLNLQRIKEFVPKGDPNLTQQQLAGTGMAGRYAIPVKPPSNLPGPGGKNDDAETKRRAKEAADLKELLATNEIQKRYDAEQLTRLKTLSVVRDRINNILATETEETKKNNVERLKKLRLQALDLEYANKASELVANTEIALKRTESDSNKQIAQAKAAGINQKARSDYSKLELEFKEKSKEIESGVTKELTNQIEEKQKFLKELDKEIKLYGQSGDQAKEEMELRMRMRGAKPRELEAALEDAATRRQNKKLRDQAEQEFKGKGFTGDDLTLRLQQIDEVGTKLLQNAEATRQLKQQIEDLNATDITQGIRNGVTSYLESIGTLSENIKGVTGSALQGLGDQLANFVTTGKTSFADLANSIIKDMIRITTQQLIMKPLLGVLGSIFPGGGAGAIAGGGTYGAAASSSIFSAGTGAAFGGGSLFAKGGIMTAMGPMPLKKYARGGVATGPQMALYGEGSQNEAYVPLPDGKRIPVAMQGSSGGSTSVVVNVDATGSKVEGDDQNSKQLGVLLAAAVQKELVKQKRPGGILA